MTDAVLELTRIVQDVSMVSTPSEQVSVIVNEISQLLMIDVCSLYRLDPKGDLTLLATHGLSSNRPVKIPQGRGIVGAVVSSRHTINLDNGLIHPDYYHVDDLREDKFKSFCGAPLVINGEVIGVLTVQRQVPTKLSSKQEALISTLATLLAQIVNQIPSSLSTNKPKPVVFGVPASEGVAFGRAHVQIKQQLSAVVTTPCHDPEAELLEWHALLKRVQNDLNEEKKTLSSDVGAEITSLFDAYTTLLLDPTLNQRVEEGIGQKMSLTSALKQAISYFADQFSQMDDAYLKARSEDVWHLGNKLYHAYSGPAFDSGRTHHKDKDLILVGEDISVSDIAKIRPEHLKAVVSAHGSKLSHTAVLANAMGVPCVVGIQDIHSIAYDDELIVDGTKGTVIVRPDKLIAAEYREELIKEKSFEEALLALKDKPALTKCGKRVHLFTNSGLLSDISPGLLNGAEGVGLFRTEIPFILRESFPTEEEQTVIYGEVFSLYKNKPIYMRTLDIGSDKQLPYFPIAGEENPAMGWRGIRFTLDNVQLLMSQVRAMLRAAGNNSDLHIMLPMVSQSEEIDDFLSVLQDAVSQLSEEGFSVRTPKLGIMLEVPAAISQLKFWHPHLDFISIGSNDLSQFVLAVDRNNHRVATKYDHAHPAVVHELYRAVCEAKKYGIPVCVCGEMASDPVSVMLLVAMGVDNLSMSSAKILRIKALIRNLDLPLVNGFLARALNARFSHLIREDGLSLINQHQLLAV